MGIFHYLCNGFIYKMNCLICASRENIPIFGNNDSFDVGCYGRLLLWGWNSN